LGAWEETVAGVAGDPGTAEEESDDHEGLDEGSDAHGWDVIIWCGSGCNEARV